MFLEILELARNLIKNRSRTRNYVTPLKKRHLTPTSAPSTGYDEQLAKKQKIQIDREELAISSNHHRRSSDDSSTSDDESNSSSSTSSGSESSSTTSNSSSDDEAESGSESDY